MLIRFSVSNFLSFNEKTEFNMLTGDVQRHKHHVYDMGKVKLLRTAAVYGANGSGKSNLLIAMNCMKSDVLRGNPDYKQFVFFKLAHQDENTGMSDDSCFEVEIGTNHGSFIYGYKFNALLGQVNEEWLTGTVRNEGDIFRRKRTSLNTFDFHVHPKYKKTKEDEIRLDIINKEITSPSDLLLTKLGIREESLSDANFVYQWFKEKLRIVDLDQPLSLAAGMHKNDELKVFAEEQMCKADVGITGLNWKVHSLEDYYGVEANEKIELIKMKFRTGKKILSDMEMDRDIVIVGDEAKQDVKQLVYIHKDKEGNDHEFEGWEESEGTNRLVELVPFFFYLLKNPRCVVLIDEIEKNIHPLLLKRWLSQFLNTKKTAGQLIFTTHAAHLLNQDYLRTDEIIFCEKDSGGATSFNRMDAFDVRPDLNIEKGYLSGRFDAIPFLDYDPNWDKYTLVDEPAE